MIGHRRLREVTLRELQRLLAKHPTKDRHNKRALSAFYGWCVKHTKGKENICRHLETTSRPNKQTEDDVWSVEQVKKVYAELTFKNLYDIFIVLGVECGMRPQEILALTWDDVHDDYLAIEEAIKERSPDDFKLGLTKDGKERYLAITPFVAETLRIHKQNQRERIIKTKGYNRENNFVVADRKGHVPNLTYVRKYIATIAERAGVPVIPAKNLRSTHISLMADLGIPLPTIQKQAGHSQGSPVTQQHYIRTYTESVRHAAMVFHERLHKTEDDQKADLPNFAQWSV